MSIFTDMKKVYDGNLPTFWEDAVGTGYFTTYIGAKNERSSQVHLTHEQKPVCGAMFASDMMYSFCSMGVHLSYVECDHCKRIYAKEHPNV
jgi:hypothetical protein